MLSETMFSNAYGAIDNFSFCFLFQNVKHISFINSPFAVTRMTVVAFSFSGQNRSLLSQ